MEIFLRGAAGVYRGKELQINEAIVIGRDPAFCQLVYPASASTISGVHCKIQNVNGMAEITDMGSTNGTFLDSGIRLVANKPYSLRDGEGFYLGDRSESFRITARDEKQDEVIKEEIENPRRKKPMKKIAVSCLGAVAAVLLIFFIVSHMTSKNIVGVWNGSEKELVNGVVDAASMGLKEVGIGIPADISDIVIECLGFDEEEEVVITFTESGGIFLSEEGAGGISVNIFSWDDMEDGSILLKADLSEFPVIGEYIPVSVSYPCSYELKGDILTIDFFGTEITLERVKE